MADEFAVKINAQERTAEVSGSDKEWVAEQLETIERIFSETASSVASAARASGDAAGAATSTDVDRNVDSPGDGLPPRETTRVSRQSRGARGTSRSRRTVNSELNSKLTAEVAEKLLKYREERESDFRKSTDQAAIIATFLQDEIGWPAVGPDDLHTVYSRMGWRTPNTRAALQNGRTRNGYFGPQQDGKFPLTLNGENFGRYDSKESA